MLVSPLDWAIMETWQKAGVPLEAVLKGIDKSYESYQKSRRGAGKPLKSLAYCTDAVLEAAEEQQEAAAGRNSESARPKAADSFPHGELKSYFAKNMALVTEASNKIAETQPEMAQRFKEIAGSLNNCTTLLDTPGTLDLEDLERRLTILDEKVQVALTSYASEELMLKVRREVDSQLIVYRRKMKAEQLGLIEKQYISKRLLEEYKLPRLSLYYLS